MDGYRSRDKSKSSYSGKVAANTLSAVFLVVILFIWEYNPESVLHSKNR